jgi:hypothetical protein
MKEKLISIIRHGVAAAVGSLTALLATWGLLDPEIESSLLHLVEVLSFIAGSVAWYALDRFLEDRFPWLRPLLFRNPEIPRIKVKRW